MSIDIASKITKLPEGTINISDVSVLEGDVYAFDFDGVISSSLEDDIYHLLSWADESELLSQAREAFKIRCESMELKYQRHLLFQAAAYVLDIPISPGPGIDLLTRCASDNHVFIITARSGWYAVDRMRKFLSDANIYPIEVFNLGRVPKDRQIQLLCREFSESSVFYIEDNPAHLEAVGTSLGNRVKMVFAERSAPKISEIELREYFVKTILDGITAKSQGVIYSELRQTDGSPLDLEL